MICDYCKKQITDKFAVVSIKNLNQEVVDVKKYCDDCINSFEHELIKTRAEATLKNE